MSLNKYNKRNTGSEKLKAERTKKQEQVVNYVEKELIDLRNKKIFILSTNKELAVKFGFGKRAIERYLREYEQPSSEEDFLCRTKQIRMQVSSGAKNSFYGKKHSEESKLKIKEARKKRTPKNYICTQCNKQIESIAYNKKYCKDCKKIIRKEIMKKVDSKRDKREERKIQKRRDKRKYNKTEKGRQTNNTWRKTPKGKENSKHNNSKRREREFGVVKKYTNKEWQEKVNLAKQIGFCHKCKNKFTDFPNRKNQINKDHNPPLSKVPKGFPYTIDNLDVICQSCNSSKQDKE